jgi:hypothetical protein
MTVDDLKRRCADGYCANQRIFGVIAQLTTAKFAVAPPDIRCLYQP